LDRGAPLLREEESRQVRRHGEDQTDFLSAALGEQRAVALVRHDAQLDADRVECEIERDVFGLEHAQAFLRLGRAVLGRVFQKIGGAARFLRLDEKPQNFQQLDFIFCRRRATGLWSGRFGHKSLHA